MKKLPGSELLALIGDGVGCCADQKVEGHAGGGQGGEGNDVERHDQISGDASPVTLSCNQSMRALTGLNRRSRCAVSKSGGNASLAGESE